MKDNETHLLLRSFDEELDPADRRRLDDLLDTSAELRAERARLMQMRAMVAASRVDAFEAGFADRVLEHVPAAPWPAAQRDALSGWMERLTFALGSWRLAGGLALAVAIVLVVLWMQPRTVHVPNGQLRTLELADGSRVELSSGSAVTYRRFFARAERRIELEGEAFFDVATGERPFVVETFNASVHVLGTRFNVRAWSDEAETRVALAEGRVAVEPQAPSTDSRTLSMQNVTQPIVLEPGEAMAVTADSVSPPQSTSIDRVLMWRSGGLAFDDEPLGSVLRSLERRFGMRITVTEPSLHDLAVTYLQPQPPSAADVLADICQTHDLRYRRTADGFEILEETP